MTAGLHRAHHDLAGVDPDADLDAGAALPSQVLAPAAEIFARRERRVQCALRMVLVRDRCAEQREDAVAGRLHDVPVVAMDRVDHRLERGIDIARASSGSRLRISSVEPLISAKSAVTVLRSPSSTS